MEKDKSIPFNLSCPVPITNYDKVLLAHGGGGTLSHQLIGKMFYPQFANEFLDQQHDSAVLEIGGLKIAFTTDSYVVRPVFFPGGNIGELAVYGTVNDLSVAGAKPLYISCGFIIEEGLPMDELWQIVQSMKNAADKAGVQIVTGDTKVVDRGKGDKIFINTSGIGIVEEGININPRNCRPGDAVILSGRIAEHGVAILSAREGLQFETSIESDCAPLNTLCADILSVTKYVRVMRDPTRGGVASALNEISSLCNLGILIYEEKIPILEEVRGACEILGLDPLYIANEGKLLVIVPEEEAADVLKKMKENIYGSDASVIGVLRNEEPGLVVMKTLIGSTRVVDMIFGEQLPRIC